MPNPYVRIQERANYDISKVERLYRKSPENKWIKENLPRTACVNSQIDELNSFEDLGAFIGKFNLNLVTQIVALKAASVSPVNFNDFLPYLDQTIKYFSCIFSENLESVNNNSPKGKSFDFGAINLDIPFDFLKIYGVALFALLEKIAIEIIKSVFIEILSVIDCDKIDRCIVPCNPSENPYKNLLVKPIIKESMNTGAFFAQKIIDGKFSERGFDITDKEMQEYATKAVSRLTPSELDCLLNGFMSSDVVKFLMELFKDHTGHDATTNIIDIIFKDIDEVVDLVPYTPTTIDNNDCGLVSIESIARMRLRRDGFTEQQITDKMNIAIQESNGKLTKIVNFLQQLPNSPPDLTAVSFQDSNGNTYHNSPIVSTVVNTSLDLIFSPIETNQVYVVSLLNKLLVNPFGEMCLAYYWTNWGNN